MPAVEPLELDLIGLLERDVAGRLDQVLDERGHENLAAMRPIGDTSGGAAAETTATRRTGKRSHDRMQSELLLVLEQRRPAEVVDDVRAASAALTRRRAEDLAVDELLPRRQRDRGTEH